MDGQQKALFYWTFNRDNCVRFQPRVLRFRDFSASACVPYSYDAVFATTVAKASFGHEPCRLNHFQDGDHCTTLPRLDVPQDDSPVTTGREKSALFVRVI